MLTKSAVPFGSENLTMLTDFYEITMANGFFQAGYVDRIVYFDMFFRRVPDNGGLAIMAGVEQLVQYLQNLHFTEEDIAYLRGKQLFSEEFLAYLRDFRFTCDVWAVPEGRRFFRMNRSSPYADPLSRRSSLKPWSCWRSIISL